LGRFGQVLVNVYKTEHDQGSAAGKRPVSESFRGLQFSYELAEVGLKVTGDDVPRDNLEYPVKGHPTPPGQSFVEDLAE
jgi:hypothetical protein